MFSNRQRERAALALSCLVAMSLTGCAPQQDERPEGSTVGVLLTEDLGAGGWTGPWWSIADVEDDDAPQDPGPRYQCQVPGAAGTGMGDAGRVAHAEAAWGTDDGSRSLVWSLATRYDDQEDLDSLLRSLDQEVQHCTAPENKPDDIARVEATLGGTEQAPVLDEEWADSRRQWRTQSAWTTTPDHVFVQVVVAWHPDDEPPADAADLLPVAVERAETLPETSPNPPHPPACEDC